MRNIIIQDHTRKALRTSVFDVEWTALPRIGERIATLDRVFQVDMVTHDVTDGAIYLTVSAL